MEKIVWSDEETGGTNFVVANSNCSTKLRVGSVYFIMKVSSKTIIRMMSNDIYTIMVILISLP